MTLVFCSHYKEELLSKPLPTFIDSLIRGASSYPSPLRKTGSPSGQMDVGEAIRTREGRQAGRQGSLLFKGIAWVHGLKQEKKTPWTEGRHGAEAEGHPRVSQRGSRKSEGPGA